MPKSSISRPATTRKKASVATPAAAVQKSKPAAAPAREPRGARRRRETRGRLLNAAFKLMAERGMEGVAINDITEAADVGFGTFYNHFETKEAIYDAVVHMVFEDFAVALDQLVKDVEDPAKMVSFCVRHALLRAQREPLWGRFLLREGYSIRSVTKGLGYYLLRDITNGAASGRFKFVDLFGSTIAVAGSVLVAVAAGLDATEKSPQAAVLKSMGVKPSDIPERTTVMALTILGLSQKESEVIARLPLPMNGLTPKAAG